jgi:hypothetical protein
MFEPITKYLLVNHFHLYRLLHLHYNSIHHQLHLLLLLLSVRKLGNDHETSFDGSDNSFEMEMSMLQCFSSNDIILTAKELISSDCQSMYTHLNLYTYRYINYINKIMNKPVGLSF